MNGLCKSVGLLSVIILLGTYIPQSHANSRSIDEGYWYIGAGLAVSSMTFNRKNMSLHYTSTTDAVFDDSGNAIKLFGGYQFDSLLGIEVGVTSFGEIVMKSNGEKRNLFMVDGMYVSATATESVSENINAIAKLGMFAWPVISGGSNAYDTYNYFGTGRNPYYGLGLDINLDHNRKRSVLIEWEHYAFGNVSLEKADTLGADLKFRF